MTKAGAVDLPTLYHYTCDHGRDGIGAPTGIVLAPKLDPHDIPTAGLVWLTDLDVPIRDALGLTSHVLRCDRTRHRYRAVNALAHVRPWMEARAELPGAWVEKLEAAPGAAPRHWWVSSWPVLVEYDPAGGAA